MYYVILPTSNDLYHHGILGQKWGKRNGPPYPLDSGRHSVSEKKAGWQKSVKGSSKTSGSGSSTKEGNILAIAAVVGVTAWDTYVIGKELADATIGRAIAKSKDKKVEKIREASKIDKKTGFHLKENKDATIEQDIKRVNPGFNKYDPATTNNCALCSATYDMRRRGFEVTAKRSTSGRKRSEQAEWYKGGKFKNIEITSNQDKEISNQIFSQLKKSGDNSRGFIGVRWKAGGGHSMAYEVQNGEVKIIDSQSGKIYNQSQFKKYVKNMVTDNNAIQYMRTDNLTPNYKKMKEIMV